MATYLYAVVRWPIGPAPAGKAAAAKPRAAGGRAKKSAAAVRSKDKSLQAETDASAGAGADRIGTGVGDPPRPVEALVHRDLAALVSTVAPGEVGGDNVRRLRRDMKAHSAVLNRLVELGVPAVLPVRFGVIFPDARSVIGTFLQPRHDLLCAHLDRLRGAAEVSLKVTYVEERALREVVAAHPELARRPGMDYQSRIDLGQRVAGALRDKQGRDARWLLDALRPVVRDARAKGQASDLMVLNASFLVDQKGLPKFDRALEKLNEQVGHLMRFDCVGPLPPYSFAELRL